VIRAKTVDAGQGGDLDHGLPSLFQARRQVDLRIEA